MLTMLELAKRPSGLWRWALMVLFSAGVVIGLLGMHTLSSGHSEHSVTSVSGSPHGHAESAEPQQVLDEGCADCGSTEGHTALMLVRARTVGDTVAARSSHRPRDAASPRP